MSIRKRRRVLQREGGSWGRFTSSPSSVGTKCTLSDSSITEDYGPGDGRDLDIDHIFVDGGAINKKYISYYQAWFSNWIADNLRGPVNTAYTDHLPFTTSTDGEYATTLLARTNPSKPTVDVPTFVGELRDIPGMIKRWGDILVRSKRRGFGGQNIGNAGALSAHSYLTWQFGLAPMISDLRKSLEFQASVAKRVKELENLKKNGLYRRLRLDNVSATSSFNSVVHSSGAFLNASFAKTTALDISGFVKWKPTDALPQTDEDMHRLAMKAVYGMTLDFSTAWNLLPWSWLIDWFSNTGDFISLNRNLVSASHSQPQIMRKTTTSTIMQGLTSDGATLSPGLIVHYSKRRRTASPELGFAKLPFLSTRQFTILGSLTVLSRLGRDLGFRI